MHFGRASRGASFEMAFTEKVVQTLTLASKRLNSPVVSCLLKVEVAADNCVKVCDLIIILLRG